MKNIDLVLEENGLRLKKLEDFCNNPYELNMLCSEFSCSKSDYVLSVDECEKIKELYSITEIRNAFESYCIF